MGTQDDLFRGLPRIESGYLVQDASTLPMRQIAFIIAVRTAQPHRPANQRLPIQRVGRDTFRGHLTI